jgi:hypothetical protein
VLLIAASIFAARKLAQYDGGARIPATVSAIADSIRWAEQILDEIDRLPPAEAYAAGAARHLNTADDVLPFTDRRTDTMISAAVQRAVGIMRNIDNVFGA